MPAQFMIYLCDIWHSFTKPLTTQPYPAPARCAAHLQAGTSAVLAVAWRPFKPAPLCRHRRVLRELVHHEHRFDFLSESYIRHSLTYSRSPCSRTQHSMLHVWVSAGATTLAELTQEGDCVLFRNTLTEFLWCFIMSQYVNSIFISSRVWVTVVCFMSPWQCLGVLPFIKFRLTFSCFCLCEW
jgi:hypothetical protein